MSHRNARPCGYADGLAMPVSWMLRGSRHRSSSHLKDFLRRTQGQGGGSGEHLGDVAGRREKRVGEGRRARGRELTVPRGPVTISRSLLGARRGVWAHAGPC